LLLILETAICVIFCTTSLSATPTPITVHLENS